MSNEMEFSPCPIIHEFLSSGSIKNMDPEYFNKPMSDYNLDRLNAILLAFKEDVGFTTTTLSIWREIIGYALKNTATKVKKSTWKRYRIGLNNALNTALSNNLAPATFLRNLLNDVATTQVEAIVPSRNIKTDQVFKNDMYMLRLSASTKMERLAVTWLEFGLLTNIRPNELEGAEMIYKEGSPHLRVLNTIKSDKSKEHVLNGTMSLTRDIELSHLSIFDLMLVEQFLSDTTDKFARGSYDDFYESIRQKLKKLTTKILGRSVSLSSARSQYAANYKALNPGADNKLAEQMGHTDVTRPMRSYSRKSRGYAKIAVIPSIEVDVIEGVGVNEDKE